MGELFFFKEQLAAVMQELHVIDLPGEAVELEILIGVFEEVDVEALSVLALRKFASVRAQLEQLRATKAAREAQAEAIGAFMFEVQELDALTEFDDCLLYTSPSPRDA